MKKLLALFLLLGLAIGGNIITSNTTGTDTLVVQADSADCNGNYCKRQR